MNDDFNKITLILENDEAKREITINLDENIYKSRIDKAIDYITTEQLYTNYQWGKSQYVKILKDLLDILKGVEKE